METTQQTIYDADFYLRISHEDGDKAESDSIANQRDLLMAFLASHPEIRLHKVRIDDGYSGVNFERPNFLKMIEAVRNKEINCVIVKDFSRLGRNFIETGKYIEKIFPFMGVRFISVNDDYDSARTRTSADSLIVPVKNLMNDAYSRDISVKIRSHLEIKRKKGKCIAPFAVYGYEKDPNNKNKLRIDEGAAVTVQDIFKKKLEGYSAQAIADQLNERGELSPLEYKRYKGSRYTSSFQRNAKAKWTAVAILRILKNPVYIGNLVQGKTSTPNYKVKRTVHVPEEKWIVAEHTHEPIISRELFDNVARMLLTDTRTSPSEEMVLPLAGLLYCGDCRRSMVRKNNATSSNPYYYYICSGHKQKSGCSSHSFRCERLEHVVFQTLQKHIASILDMERMLKAIQDLPYTDRAVKQTVKQIEEKNNEIEKYRDRKLQLHEDYTDHILSREDYCAFGKRYEQKIHDAQTSVDSLEKKMEQLIGGNTDGQQWMEHFTRHRNIPLLDRKIAVELIERISVYSGQRLHIQFKFQDEYDWLQRILASKENHILPVSDKEVG